MRKLSIYIFILCISIGLYTGPSGAGQNEASSLRQASSVSCLRLKGTLFQKSVKPLAVIEDTRSGRVSFYEEGEDVEGLEIVSIGRGEVSFKASDAGRRLSFPIGSVLQPNALSEDISHYNISRQGDTFIVDKTTVENAVSNLKVIMKNVRIKPWFKGGEASGVKVTKLTPVGILKEIGVEEGDIIRTVNGDRLNTPRQIFSAYKKISGRKELKVGIIREDKGLILTYKVE
ncbi:MAG: hypothetical protein HQ558_05530 [Candidatus Omnitrophica bacterium]|nr:hypothetical protein [Candidatus Omnitrophota bacterium]